jgi:hypothetical protein
MPNGRPGDHPYTDIVVHGSSSQYGEEVSALVRAMAGAPGFDAVREEVVALIEGISFSPRPDDWEGAVDELLRRLRQIQGRLGR